jgi:hypothetical protein
LSFFGGRESGHQTIDVINRLRVISKGSNQGFENSASAETKFTAGGIPRRSQDCELRQVAAADLQE